MFQVPVLNFAEFTQAVVVSLTAIFALLMSLPERTIDFQDETFTNNELQSKVRIMMWILSVVCDNNLEIARTTYNLYRRGRTSGDNYRCDVMFAVLSILGDSNDNKIEEAESINI